jgi:hypothetical protein
VTFTSPVGEVKIDEVRELKTAQVKAARQERAWTLEAAIPWKELGHPLARNTALRGDVGVLVSDRDGQRTIGRYYWANKSHVVMSDLPSEARVNPSLWGELRFVDDEAVDSGPVAPVFPNVPQ